MLYLNLKNPAVQNGNGVKEFPFLYDLYLKSMAERMGVDLNQLKPLSEINPQNIGQIFQDADGFIKQLGEEVGVGAKETAIGGSILTKEVNGKWLSTAVRGSDIDIDARVFYGKDLAVFDKVKAALEKKFPGLEISYKDQSDKFKGQKAGLFKFNIDGLQYEIQVRPGSTSEYVGMAAQRIANLDENQLKGYVNLKEIAKKLAKKDDQGKALYEEFKKLDQALVNKFLLGAELKDEDLKKLNHIKFGIINLESKIKFSQGNYHDEKQDQESRSAKGEIVGDKGSKGNL